MTARALKPCGTYAAYRRHLNRGEQPCDECRRAAREARYEQNRKRVLREAVENVPATVNGSDENVLRETLSWLIRQRDEASPREAASIAKGIRDTLVALREVREPKVKKERMENVIDQIAQRRKLREERIAKAAN